MGDVVGGPVALSVREARAQLCQILRDYRDRPDEAEPVYIGTHRHHEAVLISAELFHELAKWAARGRSMAWYFEEHQEAGFGLRER
ncbi:hypothetical protein F0L68_20565 [Solihabitans fulvus]|uniref:Antitoxin n=1 Tax=Solihabitans fulvus TaxID=1892852 RepID=A0A5B2XAM1_9PSEU|nr:hypothetical protein [Solihabitans fulvus]KAA2260121.1 hypothetical protein F0L68_20565 [Solihabitans fulvus]